MCRVVIRPLLFLPPDLLFFFSKAEKGRPLCSSGLTTLTTKRRPGDVGLHLTTAIIIPLYLQYQKNQFPDLPPGLHMPTSYPIFC